MLEHLKPITIIVGHYGSGKTNLAVNLALDRKAAGQDVALVDLDTVNPYFRSADFKGLAEQAGIELVAPVYAGTNLDIPSLTARLDALIESGRPLVIDVGGDDAGAAALGRYSGLIREQGAYDLLYVVNRYRYLTRTAPEALEILWEIQKASRLQVTGVVNNSNLGEITTPEDVADTDTFARETAESCQAPLLAVSVNRRFAASVGDLLRDRKIYPISIYVKKPWE